MLHQAQCDGVPQDQDISGAQVLVLVLVLVRGGGGGGVLLFL